MKKLIIIGNGIATDALLEKLGCEHQWHTVVLSDESVPFYNRIMLSPILGEEMQLAEASPRDENWYKARHCHVVYGDKVSRIDARSKTVSCESGAHHSYDALVIATGSHSQMPAVSGVDDELGRGVIGFRNLADVEHMQALCKKNAVYLNEALGQANADAAPHVIVVGAGLLGVEAATGLRRLGAKVTLMHRRPVVMNRQLDEAASTMLVEELEKRQVTVQQQSAPTRVLRADGQLTLEYVAANQSQSQQADLIVFTTGITPNIALAKGAGLHCGRGICVDRRLNTSDAAIFALGECCEFNGQTYGLVAPIKRQAEVLSNTLKNKQDEYLETDYCTQLKVSGLFVHSMGQVEPEGDQQVLTLQDKAAGIYKKIIIQANRIKGALLVGDVRHSQQYFALMRECASIEAVRNRLLFDPKISATN